MNSHSRQLGKLRADQYAFAAHLRNPEANPAPPNIEDRRMSIYRNLFINNVTKFLANSFPVLSNLLGAESWQCLIRDFYSHHRSRSPLFPDMPKELLDYLANERSASPKTGSHADPPFLFELAHYEWIETGLALAEDPDVDPAILPQGNLLQDHPVCSPLAWLASYRFPVNTIGKDNCPEAPDALPSHYLLHRDSSYKVHFIKLNIVSARLFELLNSSQSLSGHAALLQISDELQHPEPGKVIAAGSDILAQWRDKGIILGTLPVTP